MLERSIRAKAAAAAINSLAFRVSVALAQVLLAPTSLKCSLLQSAGTMLKTSFSPLSACSRVNCAIVLGSGCIPRPFVPGSGAVAVAAVGQRSSKAASVLQRRGIASNAAISGIPRSHVGAHSFHIGERSVGQFTFQWTWQQTTVTERARHRVSQRRSRSVRHSA